MQRVLSTACAGFMITASLSTPIFAQDGVRNRDSAATAPSANASERANQQIVRWLVAANQNEIALSQFGDERATNPAVKQFSQKMVTEHTQLVKQLRSSLTDRQPANNEVVRRSRDTEDESALELARQAADKAGAAVRKTAENVESRVREEFRPEAGLPMLEAMQQIDERVMAHSKQVLQQQRGAEFDRQYMVEQATAHVRMLSTLEVLEGYATGDVKNVVAQARSATAQHFGQTRDIYNQLEARTQTSGAR